MSKFAKRLSLAAKPAFKFKFTVLFEYVELTTNSSWAPNQLQFMWHRGQRQRTCPVPMATMQKDQDYDGDANTERFIISWLEATSINLLVTLYKDHDSVAFKKKEYTFILEDVVGPTRKRLAVFPLDLAQYATMEYGSVPLDMEFRPLSNKVSSVVAGLHIRCEFIKTGLARDSDMESNFSHVSDEDRDAGSNRDADFDFEFLSPFARNGSTGVMQARATLSKEQIMKELNISEKQFTHSQLPVTHIDGNDQVEARLTKRSEERQEMVEMRTKKLGSSSKTRHRVSALISVSDAKSKKPKGKKTLRGNLRAMLQGRKDRPIADDDDIAMIPEDKAVTLPATLHRSFDEAEASSSKHRLTTQRSLDEADLVRPSDSTQLKELQIENAALRSCNETLTSEVELLQGDIGDLQSEVGELQLLVEDLRTKWNEAQLSHRQVETEAQELLLRMSLRGWLCKRGVKGGPLGRRWRRRWFSVDEIGRLYYYRRSNNATPSGYIDLERILATEDIPPDRQDKNNASFDVVVEGRCYELMAHDEEEKERWINALDYLKSWRTHVSSIDALCKETKHQAV